MSIQNLLWQPTQMLSLPQPLPWAIAYAGCNIINMPIGLPEKLKEECAFCKGLGIVDSLNDACFRCDGRGWNVPQFLIHSSFSLENYDENLGGESMAFWPEDWLPPAPENEFDDRLEEDLDIIIGDYAMCETLPALGISGKPTLKRHPYGSDLHNEYGFLIQPIGAIVGAIKLESIHRCSQEGPSWTTSPPISNSCCGPWGLPKGKTTSKEKSNIYHWKISDVLVFDKPIESEELKDEYNVISHRNILYPDITSKIFNGQINPANNKLRQKISQKLKKENQNGNCEPFG